MNNLRVKVLKSASDLFDEVVAIRRHLHSLPELSFSEQLTADYIFEKLASWGLEPKRIAKTGVTADIQGNGKGKMIALRADMDALPITEANVCDYKSRNTGVMHACGHDLHMASLLGTIKILLTFRSEFSGTVRLIFQPAEEKLPGGALMVIKDGLLENPKPDFILGQHVIPDFESGKVGFRPGVYMASTDEIYITVKGKGGHAANPWKLIDPVLISSHLLVSLQQIVSRRCNPNIPTVLSFGKIVANGATNIIPDEVHIEGTFRTFNETWRKEAHRLIEKNTTEFVASMGGKAEIEIRGGYPSLENNPGLTLKANELAKEFLGNENVLDLDPRLTAEDFSYYTQLIPGCFYRLGTAKKGESEPAPLHSPLFDPDENSLLTGMGVMSYITLSLLQK